MAATLSKLSFAMDGTLCVIVHPGDDSEIAGNLHNQPGMVNVPVNRAAWLQCLTPLDQITFAQPLVAAVNPAVGLAMSAKIAAVNAG